MKEKIIERSEYKKFPFNPKQLEKMEKLLLPKISKDVLYKFGRPNIIDFYLFNNEMLVVKIKFESKQIPQNFYLPNPVKEEYLTLDYMADLVAEKVSIVLGSKSKCKNKKNKK